MGVVRGCQLLRLTPKTGETLRVGRKRSGQCLEGDLATQPCIAGAKDLSHAAFAQRALDLVRTKLNYDSNGHMKRTVLATSSLTTRRSPAKAPIWLTLQFQSLLLTVAPADVGCERLMDSRL